MNDYFPSSQPASPPPHSDPFNTAGGERRCQNTLVLSAFSGNTKKEKSKSFRDPLEVRKWDGMNDEDLRSGIPWHIYHYPSRLWNLSCWWSSSPAHCWKAKLLESDFSWSWLVQYLPGLGSGSEPTWWDPIMFPTVGSWQCPTLSHSAPECSPLYLFPLVNKDLWTHHTRQEYICRASLWLSEAENKGKNQASVLPAAFLRPLAVDLPVCTSSRPGGSQQRQRCRLDPRPILAH